MANDFQFNNHDIEVSVMGQPHTFEITDALVEQFDKLLKEHREAVAAAAGDAGKVRAAGWQFNDALLELTLGKEAVDVIFRGRKAANLDKAELATYIAGLIARHLAQTKTKNRAQRRDEKRYKRA